MKGKPKFCQILVALTCVLASVTLMSARASGQSNPTREQATGAPTRSDVPRTSWGKPDLEGVWDFATATPLQRPARFEGREFLTEAEAKELEEETTELRTVDRPPNPDDPMPTGTYNRFWTEYGTRPVETWRTSLIVDPSDGRLPPLTPDAKEKAAMRRQAGGQPPAGPEDLNLAERCILGFNAGPPLTPSAYNNNVQLFQTPETIVILMEMVHDARIVPLDERPSLSTSIRQWKGDSRGQWEGDTLVVKTRNFGIPGYSGADENLHLVERFTLLDADTLGYEFTVTDPTVWTGAWTATFPLKRTQQLVYEYACHEGNYAMTNILTGMRAEELP